MTVPNWITVGRIALVAPFVALGYGDSDVAAYWALGLFGVASASDSLDGYLARRNDDVSRLGQFLDPLADKLLVVAALIVLMATRDFPLWVAIVIAAREVAVTLLRARIVGAGGTLPASPVAKLKTIIQLGMVSWWLLPWTDTNAGHWIAVGAALIWTVWSALEYFAKARPMAEPAR